jgi:hypothetical protein
VNKATTMIAAAFCFKAKLRQKTKLNFFKSSEARKRSKKLSDFYIWFSVCSSKYKMLIKILYFISGL